jgi:UDPglucose 6-dehydrogenase
MKFVKSTRGIDRKFKEDEFYGWRADCANDYIEGCVEILTDDEEFKKFRQNPKYTPVLAHVTTEQGVEYLKDIINNQPLLLNQIDRFTSLNDKIGQPFVGDFSIGSGSPPNGMSFAADPTTIRYIKVLSDLATLYGDLSNFNIVEIGGGFGGLATVLSVFGFKNYYNVDLREPGLIAKKYCNKAGVKNFHVLAPSELHKLDGVEIDLVISNYAFSECNFETQDVYIDKILSRAKRGYITHNTAEERIERTKSVIGDYKNFILFKRDVCHKKHPIFTWDKTKSRVSVIGVGRLGLCFALTLDSAGNFVVGCDVDQSYVDKINDKSFFSHEPGVNQLLNKSSVFKATTDLQKTVQHGDLIFVTVASYSEPDGKYDVSQVDSVVDSLVALGSQQERKHLVICTNVNPGYTDSVYERLKDYNWDVSFNPETIAQGTILRNQARPDCVYIGSDSPELAQQIELVYRNMCVNEPEIHIMDRLSAELTKVSLNCYLTCKISFANMVGDLAAKIGADPQAVLSAVGADSRINNKFFKPGFGWGGPCFPRDTRAYIRLAEENSMPADMCAASNDANKKHLDFQVATFLESGLKEYTTNSVTYKPGTVILEESQQLEFAKRLAEEGISVTINESPTVVEELKSLYGDLFNYG